MNNDSPESGILRKLLFGNALAARLARGGAVALAIRLTSVALSYLMFVVLARHMSGDDFGRFGIAFSLATFVAVVAVVGQPLLVLRFIPAYQHEERPLLLEGLIRDSRITVLLGALACALLMLLGSFVWSRFANTNGTYLLWVTLLMVVMAIARHQAYTLRAFGNIALALAPRDIIWRIAVIVCALYVTRDATTISASYAINICSLALIAILAIQMFAHPATRPGMLVKSGLETDRKLWASESRGLWAVTIVQAAGLNLSVVVLGLTLSPELTGSFFAALKTAALLKLPLVAGTIVGAPLIARYYHAGQIRDVQMISSYLVIGITVPVLIGFILILIFGERILGFFGPEFVAAQWAMVLIAFGTLINALSGPTAFIMNMTGHHRQFLIIMTVTQVIALAILPVAAFYFDMLGAAATVAAGMISWNIWVWRWSRKNLSIDPTFYGVLEWLFGRKPPTVSADDKA